jgi:predicted  nucleic acid-binding Zn-ribbon protein
MKNTVFPLSSTNFVCVTLFTEKDTPSSLMISPTSGVGPFTSFEGLLRDAAAEDDAASEPAGRSDRADDEDEDEDDDDVEVADENFRECDNAIGVATVFSFFPLKSKLYIP